MNKRKERVKLYTFIREDFGLYYHAGKSFKSRFGAFLYALLEPGFWAVFYYRISHGLYRCNLKFLALLVMRLNKFFHHVDISFECAIGHKLRLPHCFDIVIGSTVVIGDDVEILNGVTLGATEIRTKGKKRHPTIENGVFIGSGAKVLGDIIIRRNAKIGANAVVIKSVPAKAVMVAPLAKEVKKL